MPLYRLHLLVRTATGLTSAYLIISCIGVGWCVPLGGCGRAKRKPLVPLRSPACHPADDSPFVAARHYGVTHRPGPDRFDPARPGPQVLDQAALLPAISAFTPEPPAAAAAAADLRLRWVPQKSDAAAGERRRRGPPAGGPECASGRWRAPRTHSPTMCVGVATMHLVG